MKKDIHAKVQPITLNSTALLPKDFLKTAAAISKLKHNWFSIWPDVVLGGVLYFGFLERVITILTRIALSTMLVSNGAKAAIR